MLKGKDTNCCIPSKPNTNHKENGGTDQPFSNRIYRLYSLFLIVIGNLTDTLLGSLFNFVYDLGKAKFKL